MDTPTPNLTQKINKNSNPNEKEINQIQKEKEKEKKENDYHEFIERDSWLELLIEKTKINQSEFKGFFNLTIVLFIFYCFTLPVMNYYKKGYLIKLGMFYRMFSDLSILYIIWPLFHFWTYTAFLHEKMIINKYPKILCNVFNVICEYGILVFSTTYCIYNTNLSNSSATYVLVQSIIHFFKMHSYTYTNRDYRENWLEYKNYKNLRENDPKIRKDCGLNIKLISSYPLNINLKNFQYFLLAPTLCYEENYPSSGKFRPQYFILKALKALFCLTLLYYIFTEAIEKNMNDILITPMPVLVIELYVPMTFICLILFYLIFECILPGFAELACFGDRQFYDDWWNSTDLNEFNRKWNKIIHMFLHRHVYLECKNRLKLGKTISISCTFIISAIFHEYVLCVLIKMFRPYMFFMMLIQIPLLPIGGKYLKKTTFGNLFFWFTNMLGVNLLFVLYNREHQYFFGNKQ